MAMEIISEFNGYSGDGFFCQKSGIQEKLETPETSEPFVAFDDLCKPSAESSALLSPVGDLSFRKPNKLKADAPRSTLFDNIFSWPILAAIPEYLDAFLTASRN
jgi:hypothetical protein